MSKSSKEPLRIKIPKQAFLPCYHHLLDSRANINFLYGGRDSGKSHFIAQRLIVKCLTASYFRCILIKKVFATIQESQWQTIKDILELWKLDHLFIFRVAPLSITCKLNGNKFIARGLDNPQSIKSVKDPSDAWHEEGNQETLDDFITVTTTLRNNNVEVQQWFSFNPECDEDYEDFWLYKVFFSNNPGQGLHTWEIDMPGKEPVKLTYSVTHTTYKDNPRCSPVRIAFLEKLKDISPYYYQVYVLGKWGRRNNNNPFFYAFSREKHLAKTVYDRRQETYLSFDFNRSPITCQVWQYYDRHLRCIESIKLDNSDIYKLCDYIIGKYGLTANYLVTGDATGQNSSALVQNGIHYYTVIKSKLGLGHAQIKVPGKNPPLKESQVLSNAVLINVQVSIDPVNCKPLIFDLENVRLNPDGGIEKKDRNDPAQQADQADCFRYLCDTFFKWVLKTT